MPPAAFTPDSSAGDSCEAVSLPLTLLSTDISSSPSVSSKRSNARPRYTSSSPEDTLIALASLPAGLARRERVVLESEVDAEDEAEVGEISMSARGSSETELMEVQDAGRRDSGALLRLSAECTVHIKVCIDSRFIPSVQSYRHDALPNNACMPCPSGQLLANIAAFPEVDWS